jgi:hypothetical protein
MPKLKCCVVHFGETILWRAGRHLEPERAGEDNDERPPLRTYPPPAHAIGVGGSVIPYGLEVDEVTAQLQRLLAASDSFAAGAIFCRSTVVDDQLEADGASAMISFSEIPNHPGWKEPRDVFTRAVKSAIASSSMAGRQSTREKISGFLEELLLVNASSVMILEGRAGFGKSKIVKETVQVTA